MNTTPLVADLARQRQHELLADARPGHRTNQGDHATPRGRLGARSRTRFQVLLLGLALVGALLAGGGATALSATGGGVAGAVADAAGDLVGPDTAEAGACYKLYWDSQGYLHCEHYNSYLRQYQHIVNVNDLAGVGFCYKWIWDGYRWVGPFTFFGASGCTNRDL